MNLKTILKNGCYTISSRYGFEINKRGASNLLLCKYAFHQRNFCTLDLYHLKGQGLLYFRCCFSPIIIRLQTRPMSSYDLLESYNKYQTSIYQSLSEASAVNKAMIFLQNFHDSTHISWWLTIVISTILMRFIITFPLAIYQHYILAKVENLKLEMDGLVKQLKMETAVAIKTYGWSQQHAKIMYLRSARRIWRELIERDNCHPLKSALLVVAQIPLWVIVSVTYRNFATMKPPTYSNSETVFYELSNDGFWWLTNLIETDHLLILPLLMSTANLLIIEVNRHSRKMVDSQQKKILTNFFRCLSLALIPVAAVQPGCLVLYWTTSSIAGLIQNLILINPRFRRLCRIPLTSTEIQRPYLHLYNKIFKRL